MKNNERENIRAKRAEYLESLAVLIIIHVPKDHKEQLLRDLRLSGNVILLHAVVRAYEESNEVFILTPPRVMSRR
jgi:hypothetical protein